MHGKSNGVYLVAGGCDISKSCVHHQPCIVAAEGSTSFTIPDSKRCSSYCIDDKIYQHKYHKKQYIYISIVRNLISNPWQSHIHQAHLPKKTLHSLCFLSSACICRNLCAILCSTNAAMLQPVRLSLKNAMRTQYIRILNLLRYNGNFEHAGLQTWRRGISIRSLGLDTAAPVFFSRRITTKRNPVPRSGVRLSGSPATSLTVHKRHQQRRCTSREVSENILDQT